MVFSANGLRYKYTVAPAGRNVPLGPATVMAGKLLVPVTDGYDVFDPATGKGERHMPLQRPPSARRRWCPRWPDRRCSSSAATRWSRSVRRPA